MQNKEQKRAPSVRAIAMEDVELAGTDLQQQQYPLLLGFPAEPRVETQFLAIFPEAQRQKTLVKLSL